jgi:ribonucleotide monophosphatase NagD (HAD superfamily)
LPHIYLTNGGGVLETAKARQLSDAFGVPINPAQVVLSHSPLRPLSARHGKDLVCVVGMRQCADVAKSYGFENIITPADIHAQFGSLLSPHTSLDPLHYPSAPASNGRRADGTDAVSEARALLSSVRALLVLHDPRDWYVDLQVCLDVLLAGRPAPAVGPDGNLVGSTGGASGYVLPHDPAHERGGQAASAPYCGAPHLGPSQLFTVAQALRGGYVPRHTPLYLSNPDLLYSARFDVPRLAQGAFTEVLGYLYRYVMTWRTMRVRCPY